MQTEEPLAHRYSYACPSTAIRADGVCDVALSTSGGPVSRPRFFSGAVLHTRQTARMLQGVGRIARTRFYTHPAITHAELARDPVITAGDGMLRFESLSLCAGVYARLDLQPSSLCGDFVGHGSTNVDFNPDMRAALGAATDADRLRLSIGSEAFELESGPTRVVERRVLLPQRWLKGFGEVQLTQAELELHHELDPTPARRFLRDLPAASTASARFSIVPAGAGVRLSRQATADAVTVGGVNRLRALADLAREATGVRIYAGARGVSAWQLVLEAASFFLVLSPQASRGFSGEGGVLSALTDVDGMQASERVRDELRWQDSLDVGEIAESTSLAPSVVRAGLAVLGAAGLVGYDLGSGSYFHRELPFDADSMAALHPRLRDAHRLLERSAVRLVSRRGDATEAIVSSGGVEHRVRIVGDEARCTCPWYGRHQGERGLCKHVLAARLAVVDRAGALSSG